MHRRRIVKASRRRPVVPVERRGSRLAFKSVTPQLLDILRDALSYSYLEYDRREGSMHTLHTDCYLVVGEENKSQPTQLITGAGYWPRLEKLLKARGYQPSYKDNTPLSPADVFKPRWDLVRDVEFRYKQRECLDRILASPYGRICCPTAFGKSFVIAVLARLLPKARFDVVTYSAEVIHDIYNDLTNHLPSVGIRTGRKSPRVLNERVMCYSIGCLGYSNLRADFLLGDEVHELGTKNRLEKLVNYRSARCFGFSANRPGDRLDGADFEIEGCFGPVILDVPYQECVQHGSITNIRVRVVDVCLDYNPCEDYEERIAKKRHGIWRNRARNKIIAKTVREYPDEQVLITVETLDHAVQLKRELPEYTLVYDEKSMTPERRRRFVNWGLISSSQPPMSDDRRYKIKRAFEQGKLRKAIATTVWNRGVNFTQLSVLARADGESGAVKEAQITGRLSRLHSGKDYGLLLDFRDHWDDRYAMKFVERRRFYRKMGWEVVEDTSEQRRLFA